MPLNGLGLTQERWATDLNEGTMENEKKLFEAWWNACFSLGFAEDDEKAMRRELNGYRDTETQMMWLAWKARATLTVPNAIELTGDAMK